MKLKFNTHKNRIFNFLIIAVSLPLLSFGQLGSTMYGLYRPMSPVSVSLIEIDPTTGVMTPVGNQVLSSSPLQAAMGLLAFHYQRRLA